MKDALAVVWTSGDKEVATHMVFMYTTNAKKQGWFEEVTFIIWGPSAKLLADTRELQDAVKEMIDLGITVEACKACADMYGVSEKLGKIGVEVKYMGQPLTAYIKEGRNVLSF
jgi:hypothetical protein